MYYPVVDLVATGARIKELRIQNHLTVQEVADFMGVSVQAIFKWQRGDALPTLENSLALSKLFGTTVNEILCECRYGYEEDERSSSVVFIRDLLAG